MKKKLISVIMVMALALGTYTVAMADGTTPANATRNSLKSFGNVVYTDGENSVEIYSEDLVTIADKLDTYKTIVFDQLGEINTYFSTGEQGTSTVSDSDIKIVHTAPSDSESVDPLALDFDTLLEGLAASQSIPTDVTEYGYDVGTFLYKTPTGELTTDGTQDDVEQISISAATPENLSAGSAAWVNGELILGTGADNKAYYDLGYIDGYAQNIGSANISYVYHQHTNACYSICHETYNITAHDFDSEKGGYILYTITHSEPKHYNHTTTFTKYYNGSDSDYGSDKTIYNQVLAAGTQYEDHNILICPYKAGEIESATIVFN